MRVDNKVVLITGGAGGIGRALTEAFLARGCDVVITGRTESALLDAAKVSERVTPVVCDVNDKAGRQHLFDVIHARFGALDMLINNAGVHVVHNFTDANHDAPTLEDEVATNFIAPVRLGIEMMPLLRAAAERQDEAAIVNISSTLAVVPKRTAPIYCASKAALHCYSQALRGQFEDTALKVFSVLVPQVETPMTRGRGRRKMPSARLCALMFAGLEADEYEMFPGISRRLVALAAKQPRAAELIVRRMTEPGARAPKAGTK